VPDYSRSYEKQCKGRCPQRDEAHHTTHSPTRSRVQLRLRLPVPLTLVNFKPMRTADERPLPLAALSVPLR
jgi:hypothetical protein